MGVVAARPPIRRAVAAILTAAGFCLAAASCERPTGSAEVAAEPVVLQRAMADVVKPQTETVLNILIAALTLPPEPFVDASKLTDSDWEIMETAATALRDQAIALRDRPIQVVAQPGDALFGEVELGTHNAVDVQGYIDAYPDHFKEDAEGLRIKADEWLTAIQARDTIAAWQVALDLDPACVDCHEVFWTGEPPHEHEDEH